MRTGQRATGWLPVLLYLYALKVTVCDGLRCYSCENEQSNFMCNGDSNLELCDQSMDTCQTMVSFNEISEKLEISKTCTMKNACKEQVNATRDRTPCDKTRPSWICTTCCNEDSCNVSHAQSTLLFAHWLTLCVTMLCYLIT